MAFSKARENTLFKCPVPSELVTPKILLESLDQVLSVIQTSSSDPEFEMLVRLTTKLCSRFVEKFYSAMALMKEADYRIFESKCKQRSADLEKLFQLLSTSEGGAAIYIAYGDKQISGDSIRYISSNSHIFAFFADRDEDEVPWVFTMERKPAFYSYLVVNVIRIMSVRDRHLTTDSVLAKALLDLAQIPISVARLYLELRPTPNMMKEDELASISRMGVDHQLDHQSKYLQLFSEVVKDINEGKLPYIREVAMARKRTKQFMESPFSDDDYYISAKGTSSRIKGQPRDKSIVASLYEVDNYLDHPINDLIQYKSNYNRNEIDGYQNQHFRTTAIPQHKIKSRVIVIGDNPLQDRCNWIHRRLSKFLGHLPSDCTRDQRKGVTFAQRVTNPGFRESNGMYDILCNDISDATGTLNQEFQAMCIGILFDPIIVDFWDKHVAKTVKTFNHQDGSETKYIQKAGQPQGILGSFDAFAWAHHVIFLMTMKEVGLENILASRCYRVLGDDSIAISVYNDPAGLFQQTYVDICSWVNWKIELSKSHIVTHSDRVSSAEFAKVTVLEGAIATPVPIRLLSRMGIRKNNYYYFSTIIWMLSNNYSCVRDQIESLVAYQYPEMVDQRIVLHLLKGGLIPQFSSLDDPDLIKPGKDRSILQLAVLVNQIKGSFIEALLNDKCRESLQMNKFELQDAVSLLMNEHIEQYVSNLENPEHKYWTVLYKNSIIEDSLKLILGIEDTSLVKGLVTLTPEQENAILELTNIIENLQYSFGEIEMDMIQSISKQLEFLDGFQLRSLKKSSVRQLSYFNDIISYTKSLLIILGQDEAEFLQICTSD